MSTENTEAQPVKLSAKEKMKNAVKEYGSTVIVFHVTISIFSLGGCYLLVSRYDIKICYLFLLNFTLSYV